MYAMLTGRLPFLVDPPNNLQKLHALILRGARVPEYLSSGTLLACFSFVTCHIIFIHNLV